MTGQRLKARDHYSSSNPLKDHGLVRVAPVPIDNFVQFQSSAMIWSAFLEAESESQSTGFGWLGSGLKLRIRPTPHGSSSICNWKQISWMRERRKKRGNKAQSECLGLHFLRSFVADVLNESNKTSIAASSLYTRNDI